MINNANVITYEKGYRTLIIYEKDSVSHEAARTHIFVNFSMSDKLVVTITEHSIYNGSVNGIVESFVADLEEIYHLYGERVIVELADKNLISEAVKERVLKFFKVFNRPGKHLSKEEESIFDF